MATFQKKYYYTFRDITNKQFTTELWQYTGATITATEIKADENPFTVTYSPTSNKFDPIRGSGCDINILSVTGLSFMNLYTTDMMGYQIRFFNSASTLIWVGYLSSELYSEPFAEYNNYTVSLTGNDGLALLERLDYLYNATSNYTGFTNNWTIITNILQKLQISWNSIYVGLSTTSSYLTISSGNTILSTTYSNNENFYDEDNKPMTCKEVLETILTPFAAYIQIINGNIYIADINTLAQGNTQTFKRYNGTTFVYETNVSINLALGDVSTIDFASDSQTLNILPPINKQKIIYSPYITPTLIDYNALKDVFTGTTATYNYGVDPYTWTENAYGLSNSWTKYNPTNVLSGSSRFSLLTGTAGNDGETDSYLTLGSINSPLTGSTTELFIYKGTLPKMILNTSTKYYLKLEASAYVRTKDNMGGEASNVNISLLEINTNLIIGNKKFDSFFGWQDSTITGTSLKFEFINVGNFSLSAWTASNISDNWVDLTSPNYWKESTPRYINLDLVTNSTDFYFSISTWKAYKWLPNPISYYSGMTNYVKDVRIKDIKFTIVDSNFNEVENNDIEYWSYIDKTIKDDGADVTCKLGTNSSLIPIAKGSIMGLSGSTYFYIQSFVRSGTTDIVENLLARSIVSNYTSKTIEIQCMINKIDSIFGTLKYNNYWTGMIFGIQGAVIDYHEATIDLTLQQIEDDSLTISKKYT